jgi:hypothetical protein
MDLEFQFESIFVQVENNDFVNVESRRIIYC